MAAASVWVVRRIWREFPDRRRRDPLHSRQGITFITPTIALLANNGAGVFVLPSGPVTTNARAVVKPIHRKAMPVILTTEEERDVRMRAPWG
jgi:hypothetical protein